MIIIPLSFRRPPLTHNRMPRSPQHKARIVRDIQDEIGWRCRSLPVDAVMPTGPVEVRLVWTVPDNRVRDAEGPEPTKKACTDGLVKAGLLPDDRHEIVRRSYCLIEKGDRFAMRLEIDDA